MSDHDLVKQTSLRRGGRKAGRVGKRGRGGGSRGCELVPVVEKLEPGQLKAERGGRGGRGGRRRARNKLLSPKRVSRKKKTVLAVSSVLDEECGVRGEGCEVGVEGREGESKLGGSEVEEGGTERQEKCEVQIRGEDGLEKRDAEKKEETETPIGVPVPKLRRTHATVITLEAMLTKNSAPKPVTAVDGHVSGNDGGQCDIQDTSSANRLTEKAAEPLSEGTVLKRRRGRPRKMPRQDEDRSSLQSAAVSSSPTREEVDAALHSVPTPMELSMLTQLLNTPIATTTNLSLDVQTSNVTSEPSTDEAETAQSRELGEEYPQPSTNYQKMQRKLARQKQLSEMRAREMAMEREKRFLRRQGLLQPEKKRDEGQRTVRWKEEKELVEVFHYSPCSSRGSTLEPDEIPNTVDPT